MTQTIRERFKELRLIDGQEAEGILKEGGGIADWFLHTLREKIEKKIIGVDEINKLIDGYEGIQRAEIYSECIGQNAGYLKVLALLDTELGDSE
jgi:hypothetical protein